MERELTCNIAPDFEVCRGSVKFSGLVASARSAKSIETSPRKPDFDDPCEYQNIMLFFVCF